MNRKVFSLVFLFIAVKLVFAQNPTINSTFLKLANVDENVIKSEKNIKNDAMKIDSNLFSVVKQFKSNPVLSDVTAELESLRGFLRNIASVSNFEYTNSSVKTCNEIVLKTSNLKYEIQKCSKIQYEVEMNSTLLQRRMSKINQVFVMNYFDEYDYKSKIDEVTRTLLNLIGQYYQYSMSLFAAIRSYTQLTMDLIYLKTTFCECPKSPPENLKSTMVEVDNSLKTIQMQITQREASLRNISAKNSAIVKEFHAVMKKNSMFVAMTGILDSIIGFLSEFEKISTTNFINPTSSCDNVVGKVALIENKIDVCNRNVLQIDRNATSLFTSMFELNKEFSKNIKLLQNTERKKIQEILNNASSIGEEVRQYILILTVSLMKFVGQLDKAETLRNENCKCLQMTNVIIKTTSG
jgi:hypothetical protein